MSTPVFKPYLQHQLTLLPQDLNDMIPKDHMVRVVDEVIESLNLSNLYASYSGGGASAHDPKMLLKVIVYAYASGTYSSRKISEATKESIYFLWLTGQTSLDHMTINRFRSARLGGALENIFSEVIFLIAQAGYITLDTYFLDGTKIEANANKYSFVWKKATDRYKDRLQQKVREHLEEIDRLNEEEDALYEGLPEPGQITSEDIAEAAARINARLKTRPKDKDIKRASRIFKKDYLPRMERYESQEKIFEERNSFSKTDTDATFMRMKDDHMRNGQLKAAYNIQAGTENQFIVGYTLHRRAGDAACMISHLESLKHSLGHLPKTIVADAGYGSEENYSYLDTQDCKAYVKHNMFHKEQKRSFKKDPTINANWAYDEECDEYTCAGGKKLSFLHEKKEKSALGFISRVRLYECEDCSACEHRSRCVKSADPTKNRRIYINPSRDAYRKAASKRLTSDEGIVLRRRRATDVETVFGNIKNNFCFNRFTLRGLEKATLEFGLIALGHNMRKLCMQKN